MRSTLLAAFTAVFFLVMVSASSAALKFDPQADANASGGWSTTYLGQTPATSQQFGACELYQFFVPTSVPRSGGSPNYTYSRYKDGSGTGCYGLWPGLNPFAIDPESVSCSTGKESAQVRWFKCAGYVLKAQRVWWPQYGSYQKGIRWTNAYAMSWLVGTSQWYL